MGEAICDLGSSINVMSLFTLNKFENLIPWYTSMLVGLANGASIKPHGKVENVIVHVDILKLPNEFIILEMEDEKEDELPFGIPFLSTTKVMMDFQSETIITHYKDDYSTYYICAKSCDAALEESTYKLKVGKKAKEVNKKKGSQQEKALTEEP